MKDSFYTPRSLAHKLLNFVQKPDVFSIADFCIGGGELLRAAEQMWPNAKLLGTDISQQAVAKMKKAHTNWNLGVCDFMDKRSKCRCKILRNNPKFDLVLLNPPFSCLGGTKIKVTLANTNYFVSTAMAFVVEALKYLKEDGQMFAILPNSVAYSAKDQAIWKQLKLNYQLRIIEESNTLHFEKCSARVIIVSLGCPNYTKIISGKRDGFDSSKVASVFRGKVSVHDTRFDSARGQHYIHTTNIQNNALAALSRKVNNKLSEISGPAVLVPRVGLPKGKKICVLPSGKRFTLSDCVIAIKTLNDQDANVLKEYLISNADALDETYKGTGARYTTIQKIKEFLGLADSFSVRTELNILVTVEESA